MSCPKCSYRGHNKVYHWGTGEIECESCGHDYPKREENKHHKEVFNCDFLFKPALLEKKDIKWSNDVWIGPNGKTSMFRPVGGVHAGFRSSFDDGIVIDHQSNPVGRIDGNGYFMP